MHAFPIQAEALFSIDTLHRTAGSFPQTRYQGSKYKLLEWLEYHFNKLEFNTTLDAFGGTGCVSYLLKKMGKQVIYNDYLKFNATIAKGLIENNYTILSDKTVDFILTGQDQVNQNFITKHFKDIYFTDAENTWLDRVAQNIKDVQNEYERALAYFALFQACIIKRPYNLFHRKNLYIRTSQVERSFGNKKTWDTPFEELFLRFADQANGAVFSNGLQHQVCQEDVQNLEIDYPDLIYIDPPYISEKGSAVDYLDFYHFLEGLVDYENWGARLDRNSKHLKLRSQKNPWTDKHLINRAFEDLFHKFHQSTLVVSYRNDGIPSVQNLVAMLEGLGKFVEVYTVDYRYVLSENSSKEALIIAK